MKKKAIFSLVFIFLLFSSSLVLSDTIIIDTTGTGNYTTIQEGINASTDGDTVLVYTGTYYENINFNGKNITVASLYIITEADSFINQTIIDGNHEGTVVKIISGENETTFLCGFTIQNGSGSLIYGSGYDGGGVGIINSSPQIKKCIIKHNTARSGGGIFCGNSQITLEGVTIYDNHAIWSGGGIILLDYSTINFDTDILSNIFLNYAARGCDFHKSSTCPPIEIVVDTFTVINPDSYFVTSVDLYGYPVNDVTMNILHARIEPVNSDLYVNPDGDNNNTGITPDEPLQTIAFALSKIASDSLHPNTIHIADGVYSPNVNDEKFPLNCRSYVSLVGDSMENTILDGDDLSHIIQAEDMEKEYSINNLTITNGYGNISMVNNFAGLKIRRNDNVILQNITVHNCEGSSGSGILICETNNLLLKNMYIFDNLGGNALLLFNGYQIPYQFLVENCVIRNNLPDDDPDVGDGGGITVGGRMIYPDNFYGIFTNVEITNNVNVTTDWFPSSVALTVMNNATVDLINSTIGDNTTPTGGAVKLDYGAEVNIINSILYGDIPREIVVDGRDMPCTLTVQNSLIQGGMWDIMVLGNNTLHWLDGNIDEDPFWIGEGDYPYALSDSSPCIDAGTIDTTGLNLPEYDLAGNPRISGGRIDMGAYEFQDTISVDPSNDYTDWLFTLQNNPNPFHEGTSILFSVNNSHNIEDIILSIYNSKGQLVKRFTSEDCEFSPYTEIYWDGTDEQGKQVAPGTYLYKLEYHGNAVVRKMVKIR